MGAAEKIRRDRAELHSWRLLMVLRAAAAGNPRWRSAARSLLDDIDHDLPPAEPDQPRTVTVAPGITREMTP